MIEFNFLPKLFWKLKTTKKNNAPLPDALSPWPRAPEMGGGTRGQLATAHVGRLLRRVATSYRGNLEANCSNSLALGCCQC